jgi:hypothetical protein
MEMAGIAINTAISHLLNSGFCFTRNKPPKRVTSQVIVIGRPSAVINN